MEQTNRNFDAAVELDPASIALAERDGFTEVDFGGLTPSDNRCRYAGPAFAWYGTLPLPAESGGGLMFAAEMGLRSAGERRRINFIFESRGEAPALRLTKLVAMRETDGAWPCDEAAANSELARTLEGARLGAHTASVGRRWLHQSMGERVQEVAMGGTAAAAVARWPELGRGADGTLCLEVEVGTRAVCPLVLKGTGGFALEAVWRGYDGGTAGTRQDRSAARAARTGRAEPFLLCARLELEAAPEQHHEEPPPCAFVVERVELGRAE